MISKVLSLLILLTFSIAQAEFQFFHHKTANHTIRLGRWIEGISNPKTIFIIPGRSSFIERNYHLAENFSQRGFDVWIIDLPGHGGSSPTVNHPQKIHIDDYSTYLKTIQNVLKEFSPLAKKESVYLFGSSMGGHVLGRFLQEQSNYPIPQQIKGAIFEAPMLDIHTGSYPKSVAKSMAKGFTSINLGEMYVIGYGDYVPEKDLFEKNKNTHNQEEFESRKILIQRYPQLVRGGPTFGWLKATFKSIHTLHQQIKTNRITTPILILTAGDDKVVDTSVDKAFAESSIQGKQVIIPGAYHHISTETSEKKALFWEAIDEFIKENEKGPTTLVLQTP